MLKKIAKNFAAYQLFNGRKPAFSQSVPNRIQHAANFLEMHRSVGCSI